MIQRDKVLQWIAANPRRTQTDLARELGVTKQRIRYHYRVLTSKGAISNLPGVPGCVSVTAKGRIMLAALRKIEELDQQKGVSDG